MPANDTGAPTPSQIRELAAQASAARTSARSDSRTSLRVRPREPHERYAIPRELMRKDTDYFWVSLACRGEPNPTLTDHFAAGWEPARAEDYAPVSGYGVEVNKRLLDLGHLTTVGPDDPIINRGLMLCVRPKSISRESRQEDDDRAADQVESHMRRLRAISTNAIGDKTRITRSVTRQTAPPADMIPDDVEMEDA